MRRPTLVLLAVACSTRVASADDCGLHGCPIDAVRWIHPVFSRALGLRGGLLVGGVSQLEDGEPKAGTMQWSIGWQVRGDAVGLPGKIGRFLDVLYSLELRSGHGEHVLLPSVEVAHASLPMAPFLNLGLAVGVPVRLRDVAQDPAALRDPSPRDGHRELRPGLGFYFHQHWLAVVDSRFGVEVYAGAVAATWAVHFTL